MKKHEHKYKPCILLIGKVGEPDETRRPYVADVCKSCGFIARIRNEFYATPLEEIPYEVRDLYDLTVLYPEYQVLRTSDPMKVPKTELQILKDSERN